MKNLFLLAILLIASVSYAQERQASVGVSYSHSPGTGNGDGLGVHFGLVLPVQDFFAVVAQAQWEHEPKLYLADGSGSAWRGRVEGRFFLRNRHAGFAPFVTGGVSGVRQTTSQYTKSATTWTVGAGVLVKERAAGYWRHYFSESNTLNRVRADEYGVELYLPLNDTKWRFRANVAAINTRFTQIGGPVAGMVKTWGLQTSFGMGRVF